ncbi:MAG: hypothetical protein HY671_03600 [Chloroflexi bacterium]|nr:hypothetical protein [Chloroflexota bacterium]
MQPQALSGADWSSIGALVSGLWAFVAAIVVFGGAFLAAHVFLPAAAPAWALKRLKGLRLVLYSVSGIAFVAAAMLLAQTLGVVPSIVHFYPRFWM